MVPDFGVGFGSYAELDSSVRNPEVNPNHSINNVDSFTCSTGAPLANDHQRHDSYKTNIARHGSGLLSSEQPPFTPAQSTTASSAQGIPTLLINHNSPYSPYHVDKMRLKLRLHFMDPLEKWYYRRKFPWKLLIQLFKIIFVTMQLSLFGSDRYSHVNYYGDNTIALCHLFVKDWDPTLEVIAYPPSQGPLAVYTKAEFHDNVNYLVDRYKVVKTIAIGSYDYATPDGDIGDIEMCRTFYKKADIWAFNQTYSFDGITEKECINILGSDIKTNETFDSEQYFESRNFSLMFDRLIYFDIKLQLTTVLLKALRPLDSPDCFVFNVFLSFDNSDHDGQMLMDLDLEPERKSCHGNAIFHSDKRLTERLLLSTLNVLVVGLCSFSLLLCVRALVNAQLLKWEAQNFFSKHFLYNLDWNDKIEFVNLWYVLMVINDVMIILGSVLKMQIDNRATANDLYDICALLLGTGSLMVWFGLLRYLGFFPKYNMLILTMRRASSDVSRFLFCAVLIYAGFVFCGWLVLGPYHMKFRSISSTTETLFALINGDDMFATFCITSDKSKLIWWYSRIYLYSFITLFIYVVLSLFIAVIMDTYETIKMYYEHGFPKSVLREFIDAVTPEDVACSGLFRASSFSCITAFFRRFFTSRSNEDNNREDSPLLGGIRP